MGKICAVKSCPSGRKLKSKKMHASQSVSFFRPTTPAKLRDWKIGLGIELKSTDYICHLHFKEEDIKMYEKFNIKGKVTILPTGKKTLRDDALPTIEHQFIPIPAHELQASVIYKQQKRKFNHNESKEKPQHQVHNKIEHQELLVDQEVSDNLMNDIEQFEHDIDLPLLNQQAHNDLQNDQETEVITPSVENFTDNILKHSPQPQSWLFSKKPNGLELMRRDATTKQIVNHLRVNKDLSITYLEEDDGMEEGQEEWLSEEVLTDDDYVQNETHGDQDKEDSNLNIEDPSQDQDSENVVQTTVVIGKVDQTVISAARNIEQQLNDLESVHSVPALPDDLDAFLIRKTDGKVLEGKIIKEETAVTKVKVEEEDGNDTDDLLRMLGEGDQKVKKKALKMIKTEHNVKVEEEDHASSDDDDYIYERSQVKTLKLAKNALIKRPATKAEPEDMSDGDDETDQSSDDGSTMQRMFEVKNPPSSAVKKEPHKKIVKHVVQVSNKSQKSDQKTLKKSNYQKPTLTPSKPVIAQKPPLKSIEVITPAPFKPLEKSTSKEKPKSQCKEETFKTEDFDEVIDEEEFLEEDDIDLDEEEFGEDSEGLETKKQRIMRPEMMDEEVPSDAESHSEDGSLYDELPSSDSEDLDDWFTLDIRAERAGDYLPLLGSKGRELLIAERRRVSTRVSTLRQSLSALTDSARRQADQLRAAAMALAEIDDTLKAA